MRREPKQLIISTLVGGLGNQMFQYAAGRALALRRETKLQLDIGWLVRPPRHVTARSYELGCFQIDSELITSYRRRGRERIRELLGLAPPVWRPTSSDFDPQVLELPGYVRLVGYWQSEKYFKDCADVIRSDFAFRKVPEGRNAELAAEIGSTTAVSVHVRRGDYVRNPAVNGVLPSVPLEYYRSAADWIRRSTVAPRFFVFSDDPDWCRANLDLDGPTAFIDNNPNRPAEDLRLMALCRHHIIANSSFGWWGAWLNPRDDKIAVAPRRWLAGSSEGHDIVPENWVRL